MEIYIHILNTLAARTSFFSLWILVFFHSCQLGTKNHCDAMKKKRIRNKANRKDHPKKHREVIVSRIFLSSLL